MQKIKFLTDYQVKSAGAPEYKRGQVVEMSRQSAAHFVNKMVAEYAGDEPQKKDKAVEPLDATEVEAPTSASPQAPAFQRKTLGLSRGKARS